MARLYVFAEGVTEQVFARTLLAPHLATIEVYLQAAVLIAHARRRRVVHRGGSCNYLAMRNDIKRFLAQEKAPDVFFTTMIDLYAIHANFPKIEEAAKLRHVPRERVAFLEEAFGNDIGDQRFIPYIQLHEFEAYLFADPKCFQEFYPQSTKAIEKLVEIRDAHESPEMINDGPDTAPSKRISNQLIDYEGAKVTVGTQVAQHIGLQQIRKRCPHFDAWVSRLESLTR